MNIRLLFAGVCLTLCANAEAAFADHGMRPADVVPPWKQGTAIPDDSVDFSEVVNFMFLVQFLDEYYGLPTDTQDPIEINPLSIVYGSNDDPDAFDVAFILD